MLPLHAVTRDMAINISRQQHEPAPPLASPAQAPMSNLERVYFWMPMLPQDLLVFAQPNLREMVLISEQRQNIDLASLRQATQLTNLDTRGGVQLDDVRPLFGILQRLPCPYTLLSPFLAAQTCPV